MNENGKTRMMGSNKMKNDAVLVLIVLNFCFC